MDVSLEMLYEQPLLDTLTEAELQEILPLFHAQSYTKEEVVFRQGDEARNFYLVHEGEFEVLYEEDGKERRINLLYPGEFFGDIALLYDEPRGATVRAAVESTVLFLTREDFLSLLDDYPILARRLHEQGRQIEGRTYKTFPGIAEDEVIIYFERRHWMALLRGFLRRAGLPFLIWFVLLGAALFMVRANPDAQLTVLVYGILGFLIPLALIFWEFIDWYNDYYIVTDQRVIHIEEVIFFSHERTEAPLNKIQNVRVQYSPVGEALKYGDMIVATAAQGGPGATLVLSYMPNADVISERIIQEVNKERGLLEQQGQEEKRRLLRAALGLERSAEAEPPKDGESEGADTGDETTQPSGATALWRGLVRYLLPVLREQRGSTIVWRKHWLILLQQSLVPWLLFVGLCLFVLAELLFLDLTQVGSRVLLFGGAMGVLVLALWLLWEYEDWRNDLYILTPETIVDQEQRPFGFDKDVRRASLDMIQDTRYVQPNPLMVWFNVGNVIITTAGQEGVFTFNWVKNPRGVQYDIFQYIKGRQEQREKTEAAAVSQELLELLRLYEEERENGARRVAPQPPAPDKPARSDPEAPTRRWPF